MIADLLLARPRPRPDLKEEGKSRHGSTARFRSDVEGFRAIAVGLVLLYHAHFLRLRGGYVGVDVFFVLSGFLITRLLVDAASSSKTTRQVLVQFYARRIRRLLPLSSVVLLATLWCSYHWLGFLRGNSIARDTRWSSAFLANIHFARIGTDYLGSQSLPSPIQHFWSLAVEEHLASARAAARSILAAGSSPTKAALRLRWHRRTVVHLVPLPNPNQRHVGVLLPSDSHLGTCGRGTWRSSHLGSPDFPGGFWCLSAGLAWP